MELERKNSINNQKKSKVWLLVVGLLVLTVFLGVIWFVVFNNNSNLSKKDKKYSSENTTQEKGKTKDNGNEETSLSDDNISNIDDDEITGEKIEDATEAVEEVTVDENGNVYLINKETGEKTVIKKEEIPILE